MRFLRSDSRFYGLLQCFLCIIDSCNKKPCIKFSPAFERPCISSLPCIGIPCMGLRAIYVPASVFKFRAKSSCNCILSPCISMQSCIPMQSCIAEITKMVLLVFDFSQIIRNHANDVLIEIVRARKSFDFIVIFRHARIIKIV